MRIVKSAYYSNWGDLFGYPVAYYLLPFVLKIPLITPNIVTITAFSLFLLGCIFLALSFPYHFVLGGILILIGYIGDDLDGQLARVKKSSSTIGDYLDKILDVLKIFLITFFASLAVYEKTQNILYILLGFSACFFFLFRYYIKLETMFISLTRDEKYLEKSKEKREELEKKMDVLYAKTPSSFLEICYLFWVKNRTIFFVDEAEFAIFIALGAFFNKLEWVLWILAISQVIIASFRFYERCYQLKNKSQKLLLPIRK